MDMQFQPFNEMDYFENVKMQTSAPGLRTFVDKYQPDFIAIQKTQPFDVSKYLPHYVPVWLDDVFVLYVDGARHPKLANAYQLRHVNPFDQDRIKNAELPLLIGELQRIVSENSEVSGLDLTLIGALVTSGRTSEAQQQLLDVLTVLPNNATALFYAGSLAQGAEQYPEAIGYFSDLLAVTGDTGMVHRRLAECFFFTGDHRAAYSHFSDGINPYVDAETNLMSYYQFALSSLAVGDTEQSSRLIDMIEILQEPKDAAVVELARKLKQSLSDG